MCHSFETAGWFSDIIFSKLSRAAVFSVALASCGIWAEEPWSVVREHPVTAELSRVRRQPAAEPGSLSRLLFQFYARYISPIDGQSCHYLPTCSAYGAEALETYGLVRGVLMTTDRLIRCHPGQQEHPVDPPVHY